MHHIVELARADLPNFPQEIIECWLRPYLESEGWPPAVGGDGIPVDRWRYLLGRRAIGYWQSIEWRKEERRLLEWDFDPRSRSTVQDLIDAYTAGVTNKYSATIPDGPQRFKRAFDFVLAKGTMPVAPVLVAESCGLSIMDGNHRISALFLCRYFSSTKPESVLAKGVLCRDTHACWIGYERL